MVNFIRIFDIDSVYESDKVILNSYSMRFEF